MSGLIDGPILGRLEPVVHHRWRCAVTRRARLSFAAKGMAGSSGPSIRPNARDNVNPYRLYSAAIVPPVASQMPT